MARPKKLSDARILKVAREVFVERGPSASLASIADKLGVSQPALSHRFGSKRALLRRALAPESLPDFIEALEAGPDPADFESQLVELARLAHELLEQALPSMMTLRLVGAGRAMLGSDASMPHAQVETALVAYFDRARRAGLLRRGRRSPDARALALAFLGPLQAGVLADYVAGAAEPGSRRKLAIRAHVDLFLNGAGSDEEQAR